MVQHISISKTKKAEREESIVLDYLEAKNNGSNITEWMYESAKKFGVSVHTIKRYIRKDYREDIIDRIIQKDPNMTFRYVS